MSLKRRNSDGKVPAAKIPRLCLSSPSVDWSERIPRELWAKILRSFRKPTELGQLELVSKSFRKLVADLCWSNKDLEITITSSKPRQQHLSGRIHAELDRRYRLDAPIKLCSNWWSLVPRLILKLSKNLAHLKVVFKLKRDQPKSIVKQFRDFQKAVVQCSQLWSLEIDFCKGCYANDCFLRILSSGSVKKLKVLMVKGDFDRVELANRLVSAIFRSGTELSGLELRLGSILNHFFQEYFRQVKKRKSHPLKKLDDIRVHLSHPSEAFDFDLVLKNCQELVDLDVSFNRKVPKPDLIKALHDYVYSVLDTEERRVGLTFTLTGQTIDRTDFTTLTEQLENSFPDFHFIGGEPGHQSHISYANAEVILFFFDGQIFKYWEV